MSAMIDKSNNRFNIAFLGSRDAVWHGRGKEMQLGATKEEWRAAAGLDWKAEKLQSYALIGGQHVAIDGQYHLVRSDTKHVLSPRTVSDVYKAHQPDEITSFFDQYISGDDRFERDTLMSLKQGEIIVATAKFNGEMTVAGDKHVARLMMSTTFDLSGATQNRAHMTRIVCKNTFDAAMAEPEKAGLSTRHNTRFDAVRTGRKLSRIVQGFEAYKAMGDAMAGVHLSNDKIGQFFKVCLDIPFDAKEDSVSTRKMNQFQDLRNAYGATVREGTEPGTAWSVLNAVTRYVDHDRSTRNGNGDAGEARFISAQFGSGAAMKAKAVEVLCEMSDIDLLKAVSAKTASDDSDISGMLKQTFRSSVGA